MRDTRALVLGGGGVTGIAWETGLLAGLADRGVELRNADLVVGTSAGSTVAAQLGSGLPWVELYDRQVNPAAQTAELTPTGRPLPDIMVEMGELALQHPDPADFRARIGAFALAADTVDEATRREVVAARLPSHDWPDSPSLFIVVADAHTGAPRVFDRDSGAELVDAVAASCAVPGVWPPVTIDGTRYVDGGVRSCTNLDYAAEHDRILVLAPITEDWHLEAQLTGVRERGCRAEVVMPDAEALAAIGQDPLDPTVRAPAARAGFAQGQHIATELGEFWSGR